MILKILSTLHLNFFPDYTRSFIQTETAWLIIGLCITFGTILSVIPQIVIIIKKRSSFGLSDITIFLTSIGQFILTINVLCFDTKVFVGCFQLSFSNTFSTFLTFLNLFLLWLCYLFIVFLKIVFLSPKDNKPRTLFFIMLSIFTSLCVSLLFFFLGMKYGFNSYNLKRYGTLLGTIASLLVYGQYLPQFYTTITLKSPGSLSLLMLEIQAPGGLMNALFMWIGQGHHWSTWISLMMAAIQQFVLLFICCYFKIQKENENRYANGYGNIDLEISADSNLYTSENRARLIELGFEFDSDDVPIYSVVPITSDFEDSK